MGYLSNATAAIAAIGVMGLASAAQAQTPQAGGTAIFAIVSDPQGFNPAIQTNTPDQQVGCILFQGLVQFDHNYKMMPALAKSWTISPDGKAYTFELNKVEWHDGKPFTSEDVKYSLLEISTKFHSVFRRAGESIDTIETPAPDKVVIKLKNSFGPFMISLACSQGGPIMPAHIYRGADVKTNPAATSAPVGTGPFKLQEYKRGDFIRMVKNPTFYQPGKPYLDAVVAKVIGQASARTSALQAGEIDMTRTIPNNDRDTVLANPKLKIEFDDAAPNSQFMYFNTKRKPLDNKRVRQALFMAVDREYLMKNAFFNIGQIGTQPFNTYMTWAVNPDIDYRKMYPLDVAKANQMLDDAGVKRGADGKRFKVSILPYPDYPEFEQTGVALKSMWAALGVDVTVEALEPATHIKRTFTDMDYDITLQVYNIYSDPALGIARTWSTGTIGRPFGNASGYSNPELDALFEKGEAATSNEDRAKFYRQVAAIVADDLPAAMLREYRVLDGASKKLHGLWGFSESMGNWENAWLEK